MSRRFLSLSLIVLGLLLASGTAARAEDKKIATPEKRIAVAKSLSPSGSFLRREAVDKPWQTVAEKEDLYTGDLILGLPGASALSNDGGMRITVRSDLSGIDPLPIFETVFILHEADKEYSMDLSLERGRLIFANVKKKGPVQIRTHVRGSKAELVFDEPGAKAALEIYGRWPRGVPFTKSLKAEAAPELKLVFLILSGEVDLKTAGAQHAMKAPPGPAELLWDSVYGGERSPQRLDKLPDWALEDDSSPVAKKKKASVEMFRKLAVTESIDKAIEAFLKSDDPLQRRAAMFALGATDNLTRLAEAMREAKHVDVWDSGVLALRHWIGREPGQDMKLYDRLIKKVKMTEVQADTVVQLLHDFSYDELMRPETYETLIEYLDSDILAIRGLAHWHLYRLTPEGQKFGFNPLDFKEARDKAVAKWKAYIPAGKLPPKSSGKPKED